MGARLAGYASLAPPRTVRPRGRGPTPRGPASPGAAPRRPLRPRSTPPGRRVGWSRGTAARPPRERPGNTSACRVSSGSWLPTRYYGRERPSVRFPPPRHGRCRPGRTIGVGPLAQLVEQGTFNPKVAGSIPARPIAAAAPEEPIRRDPRMGLRNRRPCCQQPSERGHDDRHDGSDADASVPNPRRRRRGCRARGGWHHGCGAVVILIAAEIAEALAVTTYSNIIFNAPFFTRLAGDDQGYLRAARQEEMSHYLLEKSATGKDSPYTAFFYPHHMFRNARVTLNTLVSLEDAFIAAYLVGVRDFSSADLRVTAARIMGIESDHRTLARVVAPGVAPRDGGPIERVKGIQGVRESVDPPNNNGYERTLGLTNISQAVDALLPFVDASAAAKAGFNTRRAFKFHPFTPHLPSELGAFHSFAG